VTIRPRALRPFRDLLQEHEIPMQMTVTTVGQIFRI
jgi:hypothetical protein